MCGRYYTQRQKQEIAERLRVKPERVFPAPYPPDFNIAPSTAQPVVRLNRDTGDRELVQLRWGLIPFFTMFACRCGGHHPFNARSETVAKSPTYREPFRKRRCLVPFDGFCEWKTLSSQARKAVLQNSRMPSA